MGIVTTTTHKSLRGPRAGMIFFRRGPISPTFRDSWRLARLPARLSTAILSPRPRTNHCGARALAMTTRGLKEGDFVKIGEFLASALEITLDLQKKTGKKLVDFLAGLKSDTEVNERLDALCSQVEAFAGSFAMPGH